MKLAEVVLCESVSLNGRETLRLTLTEHPTLDVASGGGVSVWVGASRYVIPSGSVRWLRFVEEERPAATDKPKLTPTERAKLGEVMEWAAARALSKPREPIEPVEPAHTPPVKSGKRGGKP